MLASRNVRKRLIVDLLRACIARFITSTHDARSRMQPDGKKLLHGPEPFRTWPGRGIVKRCGSRPSRAWRAARRFARLLALGIDTGEGAQGPALRCSHALST